jgi:hypothetical protein
LRQPDAHRGIDAVGELILSSPDGVEYRLEGTPGGLMLHADRIGHLLALRRYRRSRASRTAVLHLVHRLVGRADLPVRVHASGVEVARLRPELRGGLMARAVGLGPAEISLRGLLRALLRLRGGQR